MSLLAPLALACLTATATAADDPPKDFRRLYLFRFEFDNDTFLGSDDAFSAGWSFQVHSRLDDEWHPAYAKWVGKAPGLGDDGAGGRIVRWAAGIGQIIITPKDVGIAEPQLDDAPWAGILGGAVSRLAYDNRKMGILQVYAGCMGPCSGAESVQKFVHEDLGLGETPMGWDNQLANQALFNVNYGYRYKVYAPPDDRYFTPGRFTHDFSVGAQAAAGNLETQIGGEFEYRFGWGLPMGFTKTPDHHYHYFKQPGIEGSSDWVNLSFEYRF
jgi:hypothetical protein